MIGHNNIHKNEKAVSSIVQELKHHLPFTAFGAVTGVILLLIFRNMSHEAARELFYVFHPLHVLLSALVMASIYQLHNCPKGEGKRCNLPVLLTIGFAGSIGIATISDSILPYLCELLLSMPYRHHHIGFIEKWWLIAGVAAVGIIIAYFNPTTKFPHAGHVLISTWASLFHVIMAKGDSIQGITYVIVFLFMLFAVWVPCCVIDIVFPMLFVKNKNK